MTQTAQKQLDALFGKADQLATKLESGTLKWLVWPGPNKHRPLLLLHGGFGSWTHWVANIDELRKSRTVWALDLPGLGMSGEMSAPYTVEHFASEILASLNTLHGDQCQFDLAGFSFGALVGAHLAAAAQNRCHHFIACGAAGFGQLHVQIDLLRPPAADTPPGEAREIHRSNLRSLMLACDDTVDEMAIYLHGENLAKARFNSRRLSQGSGFIDVMGNITARLCGIWGEEDATAGGRSAIDAREALFHQAQTDCSFYVLPGVGHWAMYEDAGSFNHIVLTQLSQKAV